jgi:predicted nucleotidyltransferase component of viral defense system
MREVIKNHGHSVYERLLAHARTRKLVFNVVLQRYAMERLLHRVGISPYADEFVLKGASLFLVWKGESFRVTRDADFLCCTVYTKAGLEKIFREICAIPADEKDGITFQSSSVKAQLIREEQAYGGVRVTLDAGLHHARVPLQVDIGFGDAVVPSPERVAFPIILKNPVPRLRAYTRYSMAAEKCNAMVERGLANSRLKDFYDLWLLSNLFTFDFQILLSAKSCDQDPGQRLYTRE